MKFLSLFLVFATLFTTPVFAEWCSPDVGGISIDGTGVVSPTEGAKCFAKVRNNTSSSIAAGSIVTLDESEENTYDVETSATAGAIPRCVLLSACAASALCDCQTRGLVSSALVNTGGSLALGTKLFISEVSAGYLAANSSSDYDVDVFVGFAAESMTASGAYKVNLRL